MRFTEPEAGYSLIDVACNLTDYVDWVELSQSERDFYTNHYNHPINLELDEMLLAYSDGELPPEEKNFETMVRAVEQRILNAKDWKENEAITTKEAFLLLCQ